MDEAHRRLSVWALRLSFAGFVALAAREGYTPEAVIPVQGDRPTIGFGTANGVQMGDRTTPVAALRRALTDATAAEAAMRKCVRATLSQAEFDLFVDHMYNIGPANFCASTTVRKLNALDRRGACEAILLFRKAGGFDCSTPGNRRCRGLWDRRVETRDQCIANATAADAADAAANTIRIPS